MSSRQRTSPPPDAVAGSSRRRVNASAPMKGVFSGRSLRVGRGLAAGSLVARGRGVPELGGLDLGRGRSRDLRGERRVVNDGQVLRGGLRSDVPVVLALVVGVEHVG